MDDKDADDNFFNRERILILLDLYKLYKPKNEENENHVISLPERQEEPKRKRKRPTSSYTKRNDILTDIKIDLQAYYGEKLSMQREKLEIKMM
ncbi:hypothetical protein JTB14_022617 [Gonioctena quinquepunctata]|nr:hypothetical protein JTB14_022617 [Gonioctena quinquepunctata]